MPLSYDPNKMEDPQRWMPEPGTYSFFIKNAEEVTYKSGSQGLKLELLLDMGGGKKPITAWENIVFHPKMLWKMKHLCEAIGVAFDPPPEAWELRNKVGAARFKVEHYNGFDNLKVDDFLPQAEAPSQPAGEATDHMEMDDDIPF